MQSHQAPPAQPQSPGAARINAYLAALQAERSLSPYTLRNYRSDLYDLLAWLRARGLSLEQMSRICFREYLAELASRGSARASVTRRVSTIHAFYRHLAREGELERDPLEGVRPPRRERRLPSMIERDQAVRVLEMPEGEGPAALRDRAILELLYGAGLRVSELASLEIVDLDLDEWTVRVTGKGNKQRVALYGRPAAEAIERYLAAGRPQLIQGSQPALFLNARDGRRL